MYKQVCLGELNQKLDVMSIEIIFYQIAILASTLSAGLLLGRRGAITAAAAWALWTLIMVFTKFLFILQGVTIFGSYLLFNQFLRSEKFKTYQSYFRYTAVSLAVVVASGIGYFNYIDSAAGDRKNNNPSIAESTKSYDEPKTLQSESLAMKELYDAAVKRVENKYPKLNPDSINFSANDMNLVSTKMHQLISEGIPKNIAVERAADEFYSSGQNDKKIYRCKNNMYQDFPCAN